MSEQRTCGKGVAGNAALPDAVGAVLAAMAQNLDVHQRALDLDDPPARREHETYGALVTEQLQSADGLRAIAEHMRAAHDLPMGRHDMELITTPAVLEAFEALVDAEQDLLSLLQARLEKDRGMLEVIASHVRRPS
jgi:hypothetical protein